MSNRQPGWYWVWFMGREGCARWDGDDWFIAGLEGDVPESCFSEIGSRIPTPDEPWQTVPVEPTREMLESIGDNSAEAYAGMLGAWTAMLTTAPRPGGKHD